MLAECINIFLSFNRVPEESILLANPQTTFLKKKNHGSRNQFPNLFLRMCKLEIYFRTMVFFSQTLLIFARRILCLCPIIANKLLHTK